MTQQVKALATTKAEFGHQPPCGGWKELAPAGVLSPLRMGCVHSQEHAPCWEAKSKNMGGETV